MNDMEDIDTSDVDELNWQIVAEREAVIDRLHGEIQHLNTHIINTRIRERELEREWAAPR